MLLCGFYLSPLFQTSWETVGKKKPLVKEAPSESKENKENREKKGEREASKARPASSRKGKGGNRSRQGREAFRLSNKDLSSLWRQSRGNTPLCPCDLGSAARGERCGSDASGERNGERFGARPAAARGPG